MFIVVLLKSLAPVCSLLEEILPFITFEDIIQLLFVYFSVIITNFIEVRKYSIKKLWLAKNHKMQIQLKNIDNLIIL